MLIVQRQLFCEARSGLEDLVTGDWWSEYTSLMCEAMVVSDPIHFRLGYVNGEIVTLRIYGLNEAKVFAAIERGLAERRIETTAAIRGLYGGSGQPIYPSPHDMLVSVYLKIESRIVREREHACIVGDTGRLALLVRFEDRHFRMFNKQIAYYQGKPLWRPSSRIKRWVLSWRIHVW